MGIRLANVLAEIVNANSDIKLKDIWRKRLGRIRLSWSRTRFRRSPSSMSSIATPHFPQSRTSVTRFQVASGLVAWGCASLHDDCQGEKHPGIGWVDVLVLHNAGNTKSGIYSEYSLHPLSSQNYEFQRWIRHTYRSQTISVLEAQHGSKQIEWAPRTLGEMWRGNLLPHSRAGLSDTIHTPLQASGLIVSSNHLSRGCSCTWSVSKQSELALCSAHTLIGKFR
jgi:hypothetical protein